MDNKKLLFVVLFAIVIAVVGCFILTMSNTFNISDDPFGAPPKGTSPNCGPEDRYKFNVTINSKNDFVNFIKNNDINQWTKFDNFRDNMNGEVNWDRVLNATKIEEIGGRSVYILEYNPYTCSGFTLKMTNDGHVSVYGCCGW